MELNNIIAETKEKFSAAYEHYESELKKVHTGRAQPSMLDGINVEAYGTPMNLLQVASISVPEPQLIQISPFDPNNLAAISNAIRENSSLGLNPMDDGRVIRLVIPPLTEERRKELVKSLGAKAEECMVALRGIRHASLDAISSAKKDKKIGEDDAKRYEKQIDDEMNKFKQSVEKASKEKESEIMTI